MQYAHIVFLLCGAEFMKDRIKPFQVLLMDLKLFKIHNVVTTCECKNVILGEIDIGLLNFLLVLNPQWFKEKLPKYKNEHVHISVKETRW